MQRYKVPDMTCGHWASTVEKAVKSVDPQASVSVDLATKKVSVDGQADRDRVAEAIRSAGYEPQSLGR